MTLKALLLVELAAARAAGKPEARFVATALAGSAALGVEVFRLVLERIGLSGPLSWGVLGLGGLLPALMVWYAVTLIGGVLDLVRRFAREVPVTSSGSAWAVPPVTAREGPSRSPTGSMRASRILQGSPAACR